MGEANTLNVEQDFAECRLLIEWLFGGDAPRAVGSAARGGLRWFVWWTVRTPEHDTYEPHGPTRYWREQVAPLPTRWKSIQGAVLLAAVDQAAEAGGACGLGAVTGDGESMRLTAYRHPDFGAAVSFDGGWRSDVVVMLDGDKLRSALIG